MLSALQGHLLHEAREFVPKHPWIWHCSGDFIRPMAIAMAFLVQPLSGWTPIIGPEIHENRLFPASGLNFDQLLAKAS